jgi:hypothetical protein
LRYAQLSAIALFLFLSGCGGGQNQAALPALNDASTTSRVVSEAAIDALPQPLSTPVAASNDLLYIGNQGTNSITVYHHDAQGNTPPLYTIAGPNTQLNNPGQLSEDAAGNLYVANGPSVLVFAHGAHGNVAPIRKISGPATGIVSVWGVTVDKTTGKIFVLSEVPNVQEFHPDTTLMRFPPNANGNATPFAIEPTGLNVDGPTEISSDSTGQKLFIKDGGEIGSNAAGAGIYEFGKQFSAATNGPVVSFVFAGGVVDDPATKTYLSTAYYQSCANSSTYLVNSGILRLAEGASGTAEVLGDLPCTFTIAPKPISLITSAANCSQLAIGYLRNIYAVCGSAIKVYTPQSNGDVKPLRVLSGRATNISGPFGIYEGK